MPRVAVAMIGPLAIFTYSISARRASGVIVAHTDREGADEGGAGGGLGDGEEGAGVLAADVVV